MFKALHDFITDERGDNIVVAGIILAVLSLITFGALNFIKPKVKSSFDNTGANLDSANAMTY